MSGVTMPYASAAGLSSQATRLPVLVVDVQAEVDARFETDGR